ncbi:MAG: outer membrane beta-barrel protein [Pseudorhodoplanes sp.]
MRFVALLSAAAVAFPAAARAEDMAGRFSGFHVGANVGAAWGRSRFATDPGCPGVAVDAVFCNAPPADAFVNGTAVAGSGTGTLSGLGFAGGVQTGLNWQNGAFVFGAEADFGVMSLHKSASEIATFPFPFLGTQYALTQSVSTDWIATLRGRVGWVMTPQLLVYVTGGAAFTTIKLSGSYADNAIDATFPGGTGIGSDSQFKVGWALGGGMQWALNRTWSVKAEYLYADFGTVSAPVPLTNTSAFAQTMLLSNDLAVHLVRFGVDYRF